MTGPEHYREAETLINKAFDRSKLDEDHPGNPYPAHVRAMFLAAAQVHATLALAAATATTGREGLTTSENEWWYDALLGRRIREDGAS